jgi:amphi-Trp domain-containing protein
MNMSSENSKIEVKAKVSPDKLIEHLHALADSFASGRIVIEQAGRFTALTALEAGERLELEIEAEEKKGKCKLNLSVSWQSPRVGAESDPFTISADLPTTAASDDGLPPSADDVSTARE